MDYTTLTLGYLMSHKDQNIRRQAIAIFKLLTRNEQTTAGADIPPSKED